MERRTAIVAVTAAGALAGLFAADILKELGMTDAQARDTILSSVRDGYVQYYPAAKAMKAAGPAARAGLVRNALSFARLYTESDAFRQAYLKSREQVRPQAPSGVSADERIAKMLAEQRAGIDEAKKNAANPALDPTVRKGLEDMIKAMSEQYEKMAKDPRQKAMLKQMYEAQVAADQEAYRKLAADWENRLPAEPKLLIARRLRQFLEVSATVDFNAKLVQSGTKMRFADARFEGQSSEWKLCYRAGKEAVDAARAFAQSWLNELPK